MAMQSPDADYLNYNYNYLVIQTIMKMRDAKADSDRYRYWTYFEFAIQLVLSYLEPAAAAYIQQDFDKMEDKKQAILHDPRIADKTKEMSVNILHEQFADKHRYFILKALNKIGIVKVSEDGEVDFDKLDLELMSYVIRQNRSSASTPADNAQPAGGLGTNPDLTLVVAGGKIYRMGSDDYKKYVDQKLTEKLAETADYGTLPNDPPPPESEPQSVDEPTAKEKPAQPDEPSMPDMPDDLPAIGWQPKKKFQTIETEDSMESELNEETQD